MGSVSMMLSLERFLDAHRADLTHELLARLPASIRALEPELDLGSDGRRIEAYATWRLVDGTVEHLELQPIDADRAAVIDDALHEGDCRISW